MRPPAPLDPHERLLLFTWRLPQATSAVVGAVDADDATIAKLAALPGVSGAFGLATCQRRLFAIVTETGAEAAPGELPGRLAKALGGKANALPPPEIFHGWAAVEHLTAVAAGLDALVQGESEVGGQFRQAAARAERLGHADAELTRLLGRTTRVARNLRRTQGYGGAPSVLPLLEDRVRNLLRKATDKGRRLRVAIIGTGQMGRSTERWIRRFEPELVHIVSRDAARAAEAAADVRNAVPLTLDAFRNEPPELDVIFVALSTTEPVLDPADLATLDGPLLICDLSLPRAVAPSVAHLEPIELVHIEDLAADSEPHHAAHLALQVEIAAWRRRALVEAQKERIDRLDKALRQESDALLAQLPKGSPDKDVRRRLARMRHIALEQLTDALGGNTPPAAVAATEAETTETEQPA